MLLKDYFPNINKKFEKIEFSGVAFSSKNVKKNFVFFAIKGSKIDGNRYIDEAINRGATIVVTSNTREKLRRNILFLKNKNPRRLLSLVSSKIYKDKPKNLIAVTGTNGKTSISNFYYQILKLNKKKVAYFGTLGINGKAPRKKNTNTTFDPISVVKNLNTLKKKKINNVILEASSHGLKQHRLDALKFDIGIFTNLSRDHLDYHKNMNQYLNSKLILFKKLMKNKSWAIFDEDTKISNILKNICEKNKINKLTVGKDKGNIVIKSHSIINNNQKIEFSLDNKHYYFTTQLIGKVQVKNLLMSVIAAHKSKISLSKILKTIHNIKAVPGRFEKIGNLNNNAITILDYAHTPDALETCILNVKEQFRFRKINILFGCGGDRDKYKRPLMGQITNRLCDKIYLTDDNPRTENPKNIRRQIKAKISNSKLIEMSSRKKAIDTAVSELKSNEILIVAGKGHENYQEYKKKKFFSDKEYILQAIKKKNKKLSKNIKNNILNEQLDNKIKSELKINNVSINSKQIKKNDIFFGIRGKNFDGNKFADEALKKKASVCIIDRIYKNKNTKKILVKNSLSEFSKLSSSIRETFGIPIVAITGSAGKTSLKELLAQSLNQILPTVYSKKSYNNKYGVPLSLFNIKKKHEVGVFEIGMDKKGEIDYLSKLIQPDLGVITNISYAHAKNFKSLKDIAKAKGELIDNISPRGKIILNADDNFFNYFRKKSLQKGLKVISFGKNPKSTFRILNNQKINNRNYIEIKSDFKRYRFDINPDIKHHELNILAAIAVMSNFIRIENLNKNIFKYITLPPGRGNLRKLKISKKIIYLVDESYNSNPLSLKFSIKKFNKIKTKSKKYLLLGDMLELGKFSRKLHLNIASTINKSKIHKTYVYGKDIIYAYNKIRTQKKGRIFFSEKEVTNFIKNEVHNKGYLMVKGSNSTGLNKIIQRLN